MGFENTYVLAVRKSDPRFKTISLTSELEELSFPLSLASKHEFTERKDGWRLFSKNYKLNLKNNHILSMSSSLMYSALDNKKVDMIVAYSTDGRMKAYQLKTLVDDKEFFPSYLASYLTRQEVLKSHPEVKDVFKTMGYQISEEDMTELNNKVDQLKKDISETAQEFLFKKEILKPQTKNSAYGNENFKSNIKNQLQTGDSKKPKTENSLKETANSLEKEESLLSYYYKKRSCLLKIVIEHLILVFTALILALLFSLPVSIWAVYNTKVEKVLFFLVNTLQTIPGIALLGALIPFLGIGFAPAITALFIYSPLPLN